MKKEIFTKNKLVLILLFGVLFVVISLPTNSKKNENVNVTSNNQVEMENYEAQIEERLNSFLSAIEGAGEVRTMVTLKSSRELVVKSDISNRENIIEEKDNTGGVRNTNEREYQETVIYQDGVPYVVKELEPEVEGVVVIAKGADSSVVATKISEAIQSLFDIPAHKIKVIKMK